MSENKHILRSVVKISMDATFEEMQDTIRVATVNPNFELPQEMFDRFKEQDKVERARREKLIQLLGPFYDEYKDREDPDGLKKKKEINDILQYLQFEEDDNWKIIGIGESPDFVIEVRGERIGLELTGLYDLDVVAQISKRQQICADVESYLKCTHPEMAAIVNVFFEPDISKTLSHKVMIPQLVSFLWARWKGENVERPNFLVEVDIKPHKTLQVNLAEKYPVKDIDSQILDELIAKKEAKINEYKRNSNLEKIWLLVIVDGASERSAPTATPEMMPQRPFAFDRVMLYNSFKEIEIATFPNE